MNQPGNWLSKRIKAAAERARKRKPPKKPSYKRLKVGKGYVYVNAKGEILARSEDEAHE